MPPQQPVASQRRSLEKVNVWALIATLILAVVVIIPSAAVPSPLAKSFVLAAGTLITLAIFIFARLSRGNVIFPPFLLLGALWLPAIAYGLSAALSGTSFSSALWGTSLEQDTFGFILVATLLGTLTALVLRRTEQYRSFLVAAGYALGAVVALQALILIVGQVAPSAVSPAFSIVGSFGDLALLLGLGLISLLLTFRFLDVSRRARVAGILMGVIALALLAIANASLVWILVALVSLGLFVESVMRRNTTVTDSELDDVSLVTESTPELDAGNRSLVLPLVVLAVSLFFLIGGTLGSALANSLHASVLNVRPSWQSTFAVTRGVYAKTPLFGSGPNTFGTEWLKYRDATLNSTVFWNLDFSSGIGFIPTSFVTTGIVGALAWVGLLVLLLVFGLRMLILRAPREAFLRYVAILSFIGSLYLFIVAIFDQPNAVLLALLFVFIGLFASTMRFADRGVQRGIVFSKTPRLGFVVVFSLTLLLLLSVAAAYGLAVRTIAASELAQGASALAAGNVAVANASAQNSIAFAQTPDAYLLQAEAANAQINAIAASSTLPAAAAQQAFQTALSAGINAALTATQLAPSDYRGWIALGNLYAQAVPFKVSGAYQSAHTAYQKAAALNPTNAQIPYIEAQLEIANKDSLAAETDLKAAIALKQNYTSAIFLLSQLEVQDGNVKDALTSAEAANYFTPGNPNILFQIGILSAAENDLVTANQALSAAVAANPQFANARYFLAAVEAKQGNLSAAITQLEAIAALSAANKTSVTPQITTLQSGKDPFPANLLSASSTPLK